MTLILSQNSDPESRITILTLWCWDAVTKAFVFWQNIQIEFEYWFLGEPWSSLSLELWWGNIRAAKSTCQVPPNHNSHQKGQCDHCNNQLLSKDISNPSSSSSFQSTPPASPSICQGCLQQETISQGIKPLVKFKNQLWKIWNSCGKTSDLMIGIFRFRRLIFPVDLHIHSVGNWNRCCNNFSSISLFQLSQGETLQPSPTFPPHHHSHSSHHNSHSSPLPTFPFLSSPSPSSTSRITLVSNLSN